METANCLPKSCENIIHHKNGPSTGDIKVGNINNDEGLRNHCEDDDEVVANNDDQIEALASQLKDVSAGGGGKVFGRSPNGYWIETNYCENGIDNGKRETYLHSENDKTVKVVADSQNDNNGVSGRDDDEMSSTSTATTTITTTSPGSNPDLEIESCASDTNGDLTEPHHFLGLTSSAEGEEKCGSVNRSGPFECTYVSCCGGKSTPVTVSDSLQTQTTNAVQVEERTLVTPSVTDASFSYSVTHSPLKSNAGGGCGGGLLPIKFSNPCRDANSENMNDADDEIRYEVYTSELQMGVIMRLIQKDLSEPYSIYTYRYFIHNWPKLCFLAMYRSQCVGAIVCKLDLHKKVIRRGYIAMLAVDERYRKRKIGSNLVLQAIQAMIADDADEVVLETEISNKPALRLYENLGFVRDKRLFRYYLNGVDALRLKLWLH